MRISDWSSDVCSSDLFASGYVLPADTDRARNRAARRCPPASAPDSRVPQSTHRGTAGGARRRRWHGSPVAPPARKSVAEGKSVSVRVDLGGRRNIKKKNTSTHGEHARHQLRTRIAMEGDNET